MMKRCRQRLQRSSKWDVFSPTAVVIGQLDLERIHPASTSPKSFSRADCDILRTAGCLIRFSTEIA